MKVFLGCFIGLVLSVSIGAESLLEGRVRLSSGQPAVGVQVRLFDLTDLRRFVGTTTDESGHFALSLRAFSTDRGTALPTDFALGQNYPNPFNPSTTIPYQIPASAHVRLEVFNLLGQRLATLVDGVQSAGAHTVQWDATDAAGRAVGAGVYIYRLSSGGMTESRRMVLVDGQAGISAAAPGPVQSAVESLVEAEGSVYGLTVSGEGLVTYVDPAFRVGDDIASIVVEPYGSTPRMKVVAIGILGDVNDDGHVDVSDVLYILLYITMGDSSMILPNNGDISLGDVNKDGTVDLTDALLLLLYTDDPSDPVLPIRIGELEGVTNLTQSAGYDRYPSWSPDGGRIAFVSFRDGGDGEVYAMDADGTSPTRLTQDASDARSPSWSLDGERIAFMSNRDGDDYEIYVMAADGTNLIRLTQDADYDWFSAWSPDSKHIAFESYRDGNGEVYVMAADGTSLTNLTQDAGADWSPSWSPDGERIAFRSDRDGDDYEIYVMDANGSNPTSLTQDAGDVRSLAWSPDGERIAFVSFRDGKSEIYVMAADGTNLTNLKQRAFRPLAWSPDGERIAFMSDRRDETVEIYVVNADGTDPDQPHTPLWPRLQSYLVTGWPTYRLRAIRGDLCRRRRLAQSSMMRYASMRTIPFSVRGGRVRKVKR